LLSYVFLSFMFMANVALIGHASHSAAMHARGRDMNDVVITLERYECYGECPVYSVSIRGDGTVIYRGKKFVRVKGERRYKIPKEKVAELVDDFYKIDYFSLEDEYTKIVGADGSVMVAVDLPGATTSIAIGGKTKSVYNYFGGPAALKELERKVDLISESAKFVRRI
jgi:hypothetical protein